MVNLFRTNIEGSFSTGSKRRQTSLARKFRPRKIRITMHMSLCLMSLCSVKVHNKLTSQQKCVVSSMTCKFVKHSIFFGLDDLRGLFQPMILWFSPLNRRNIEVIIQMHQSIS